MLGARPTLAALALLVVGCSLRPEPVPGSTEPQVVDLPYEGVAFPNRRPPFQVPAGGALFAVGPDQDRLVGFDAASGDELREVPVGRDPVGSDGPSAMVVDRARNALYIALSYPEVYTGAHVHEGSPLGAIEKIALDDLRVLGEIDVDADPQALALSADGSSLVVTHYFAQGLIDARTAPPDELEFARGRALRIHPDDFANPAGANPTRVRACVGASGLALPDADGGRAVVACYGEDSVAVVPLDDSGSEATRFAVGAEPGGPGEPKYGPTAVALSPDGARAALPCALTNDVRVVAIADGELQGTPLASVGVPGTPVFSSDGTRLLVPESDPGALVSYDLATGDATRTPVEPSDCSRPLELAHAGAGRLLLRCGDGALQLLDAADFSVITRAFLGAPASDAVLLPVGGGR